MSGEEEPRGKRHQDAVYRAAAGHGAAEQRKIDLKAKPRCRLIFYSLSLSLSLSLLHRFHARREG